VTKTPARTSRAGRNDHVTPPGEALDRVASSLVGGGHERIDASALASRMGASDLHRPDLLESGP
jgi:hypothetical protein